MNNTKFPKISYFRKSIINLFFLFGFRFNFSFFDEQLGSIKNIVLHLGDLVCVALLWVFSVSNTLYILFNFPIHNINSHSPPAMKSNLNIRLPSLIGIVLMQNIFASIGTVI